MSIDAMKQALEALELSAVTVDSFRAQKKTQEAIATLRTAIEQARSAPVQEPVAWATMLGSYAHVSWGKDRPDYPIRYEVPLYTTPPAAQRQHVTDGSPCWCNPETRYTDPETGASVIVHKEPQ